MSEWIRGCSWFVIPNFLRGEFNVFISHFSKENALINFWPTYELSSMASCPFLGLIRQGWNGATSCGRAQAHRALGLKRGRSLKVDLEWPSPDGTMGFWECQLCSGRKREAICLWLRITGWKLGCLLHVPTPCPVTTFLSISFLFAVHFILNFYLTNNNDS